MNSLHGNYVDLLILGVLFLYVWNGTRRGVWSLLSELAVLAVAILAGLRLYPLASRFLFAHFAVPPGLSKALGFVAVSLAVGVLANFAARAFLRVIPLAWWRPWWSRVLAIPLAILDGVILLGLALSLLILAPIPAQAKADITRSQTGGFLVQKAMSLEEFFGDVFGDAIYEARAMMATETVEARGIPLNVPHGQLTVDEKAGRFSVSSEGANRIQVSQVQSLLSKSRRVFGDVGPEQRPSDNRRCFTMGESCR